MHTPSPRRTLAVALTLVLTTTAGCDSGSDRPPAAASVVSFADLGTVATNPAIRARDVGASASFQGHSVWIYGDTFLANPDESGRTLLSNTWSWTTDSDARDGLGDFLEPVDSVAAPVPLLPETDAEREFNDAHAGENCAVQPCWERWALWPTSLVQDPERDRALVFYSLVKARPGAFEFRGVGTSVAEWTAFDQPAQRPVIDPLATYPTLLFNAQEPAFGSAAFIDGGQLYSYGCKLKDYEKACKLARVPLDRVFERRAWEYYAGDGWTSNISQASTVFDGNDMMTVTWNAYLGRYMAVYSRAFSNAVVLRTAPAPEGPWSREVVLFAARAPAQGENIYDALAHAEYALDEGRTIFVSYSRATAPFESEVRLVSVELQRMP